MKKQFLFILCLVCVVTACTQTSDECQFFIDNRLSEDVEVLYTCRNYLSGDSVIPQGNAIRIDTVPAQQNKQLLIGEQYGGSPSFVFTHFTVRKLNNDTIFSWTTEDKDETMDEAWIYSTEVVDKTRYWRHFIHKSILIIEE